MIRWLRRRRRRHCWSNDHALVTFGKRDAITVGNLFENLLVIGGVGSGKTSGSLNTLLRSQLLAGQAGMILTVKAGDAERIRRLCSAVGRADDLIVINPDSDHQFNYLDYTLGLQSRGGSMAENLMATLESVMKVAQRATGERPGQGAEKFFEHGIRKHGACVISLVIYATGGISVPHIMEVMRSVPRSREEADSETYRRESLIPQLLAVARAENRSQLAEYDLKQIESYLFIEFPGIAERTRSIFEAGVYGIVDLLSRGQLHWMFGRGTNVTPELCEEGKILVIDLPTAVYGPIGMIAQTLWKTGFQKYVLTRGSDKRRPLFLFSDEFQELVTVEDFRFASLSREHRTANIWATQSIASLQAVLGGDETGRAACDSLLGLANYKVFHSNSCPISNSWAADLIGKRRFHLYSTSISHPSYLPWQWEREEPGISSTASETIEHAVMPHEFSLLKKPMLPHLTTEAIVYGGGRVWRASNDIYLRTTFKLGN